MIIDCLYFQKKTFIDCSAFKTKRETGIYKIYPKHSDGFEVYCDFKTDKGGWTVNLNGPFKQIN